MIPEPKSGIGLSGSLHPICRARGISFGRKSGQHITAIEERYQDKGQDDRQRKEWDV